MACGGISALPSRRLSSVSVFTLPLRLSYKDVWGCSQGHLVQSRINSSQIVRLVRSFVTERNSHRFRGSSDRDVSFLGSHHSAPGGLHVVWFLHCLSLQWAELSLGIRAILLSRLAPRPLRRETSLSQMGASPAFWDQSETQEEQIQPDLQLGAEQTRPSHKLALCGNTCLLLSVRELQGASCYCGKS